LIDNVLSVSRLESGRFKLNPQSVELGSTIQKVIAGIGPSTTTGHEIHFASCPTDVVVRVDRDQFEQILVNLIGNALKYSPSGGLVEVGLDVLAKGIPPLGLGDAPPLPMAWALVTVRDQGIGVPQSQRRLIFDKFYRGDAPAVRKVAGTGLGLYICRSIVEAHGGHIWVESDPGIGSTFYVALPQE